MKQEFPQFVASVVGVRVKGTEVPMLAGRILHDEIERQLRRNRRLTVVLVAVALANAALIAVLVGGLAGWRTAAL